MDVSISATSVFLKNAKQLNKRYKSMKSDLQAFRDDMTNNPFQGTDLGDGMRKVRMAITSKGKGKSGGARIITYIVKEVDDKVDVTLLTMYDKSDRENISNKELQDIKKAEGL